MSQETSKSNLGSGPICKEDKYQVDANADSGFLSGNILPSSESIDFENEETDEKIAPEPAKASASGYDLELAGDLKDLSIKEATTVETFDSGILSGEIELQSQEVLSKEYCEQPKNSTTDSEQLNNEQQLENWEIYYTQDDDGDT